MTNNRKIAMRIALGNFLSEDLEPEIYDMMSIDDFADVLVWQPFEYMDKEDLCGYIEGLADAIERELNEKDMEIISLENQIEEMVEVQ